MNNQTPHPLQQLDGYMNTVSGIKFNLLDPKQEMIDIRDIAAGLSNMGHFNGQTLHYFSIAQHSLLALHLYLSDTVKEDPLLSIVILLHDAAEAYVGDVIKPLKVFLPYFKDVENRIQEQIALCYGFDPTVFKLPIVKHYDILAQQQEFATFYKGANHIKKYLTPKQAREEFLNAFYELKINWGK